MVETVLETRSAYLLRRAVERSQRTSGVQLPRSFFRAASDEGPPLARMMRGGRGGAIRLKLYLTMCLMATKAPYHITQPIPGRVWAEMLDLRDPEVNGARRITDAMNWLADESFVRLVRKPGSPPEVRLRSASGDGTKYVRPRTFYVQVPLGLWRMQWIAALSGRELAVLLALLDLQSGKDAASPPSMNAQQRQRYGLSQDTWTRAEAELKGLGLLTVRRSPQGTDFDWRRMRNTYWIDVGAINSQEPKLVARES